MNKYINKTFLQLIKSTSKKNTYVSKDTIYSKPPVALPLLEIVKKLPNMFPLTISESINHYKAFKRNKSEAEINLINAFIEKTTRLDYKIIKNNDLNFNELCVLNKQQFNTSKPKKHVILIHGYAAAYGLFISNINTITDTLINQRNENMVFHCLDLPGFGNTNRTIDFPFKLKKHNHQDVEDYFVNKINDYLNNLKIHEHDDIDVIAHSCGGYFMTLFANKITNKNIKKFIILSPAGLIKMKNLPKAPLFFKVLWESYNVSPFSLVRNSKMFGSLLTSGWSHKRLTFLKDDNKKNIFHQYIYNIFNQKGVGEYMLPFILKTGADPVAPLYERLIKNKADSLIFRNKQVEWVWVYGDNDVFSYEGGELFTKKMVENGIKSKVFVVSKSGHHMYMDNATEFNSIIINELT
ncbi:hypothetical protein FOG50_00063 [Hanseniaspora uvarum]|nr:hypothetical protein FOG50_00063 [Hanseniaspora uvarum]